MKVCTYLFVKIRHTSQNVDITHTCLERARVVKTCQVGEAGNRQCAGSFFSIIATIEILIKTDQVSNKMSRQHYPGSQAGSPASYSSEKLFVKEFPFRQRWLSSCQLFGRLLSVERRSCELITLMVTNQNPGCGGRWPIRGLIMLIMRWWYLDPKITRANHS